TMATTQAQFITSKGATFVVEYRGLAEQNASVRLVWLHGWGQARNAFSPLSSAFERSAFCCLIDLPGFGEAPIPPLDWGTPQYAVMLGEWLAQTARKNSPKTVIVAHSFGARVAIHLASRYSHIVNSLVLISGAGLRRRRPLVGRLKASLSKAAVRIARGIDLVTTAEISERLRSKLGSRDYRKAGAMRPILVRVVNEDLAAVARTVSQPTLLLYGERDQETPSEFGQRYASLIRNSRLVILPHFDHYTILTSGRHQLFRTINEFLTTLEHA
ncbi:MAG: alpha/beta fold hydrolase, partial [Bacteroidota bacterium]